ncbi:hypothetical protein [Stygiolobus caldivivus]|uniref:Uncharacterized protein n=1 Tax=Stygiolobus caldivivus TaxID=2824673 RepID=A0A8D5ZJ86_9CREN|nr:hypothetical protein [Stygiolobus caldivivus]BCU70351.1 hypothetical protein KN1_16480 [Stygiolobus caldivivus]
MRTEITLTLDEEILKQVELYALSEGISLDDAFNDILEKLILDEISKGHDLSSG